MSTGRAQDSLSAATGTHIKGSTTPTTTILYIDSPVHAFMHAQLSHNSKYRGILDALRVVLKEEGISAFWCGAHPLMTLCVHDMHVYTGKGCL